MGYAAKYRIQRIIPLYLTVWFYNIAAAIIVHLTGIDSFSFMAPESVTEHIFPICGGFHWFFVAYAGVFLLMPLINSAVRNTDEKQLIVSVTATVLLLSCVGTFANKDVFVLNSGYSCFWILIMYILGAVLRRFDVAEKLRLRTWLLLYLAVTLLVFLISVYLKFLLENGMISHIDFLLYLGYTSPFTVIQGICLVMGFAGIRTGQGLNRVIAFAAPHAFSVYIIHSTPFVWDYVMKKAFTWISDLSFPLRPLSVIGCAAAVFIICVIIDIPRAWLFSAAAKLMEKLKKKKQTAAGSPD